MVRASFALSSIIANLSVARILWLLKASPPPRPELFAFRKLSIIVTVSPTISSSFTTKALHLPEHLQEID